MRDAPLLGKIAGATGSYQAHLAACPDADWPAFAEKFVTSLGLKWNKYVTQIEPHDCIAELFHAVCRCNTLTLTLTLPLLLPLRPTLTPTTTPTLTLTPHPHPNP